MKLSIDNSLQVVFAQSKKAKSLSSVKSTIKKQAVGDAPEVVTKITSFASGGSAKGHMEYLTKYGEIAQDAYGDIDDEEIKNKLDKIRNIKGRQAVQMVWSMPHDVDFDNFKPAVEATLKKEFGNHDYMHVYHTPEVSDKHPEHPHVHIVVPMVDEGGKRINPRKADIQQWRETLADELEKRGELALATPARARKQGTLTKAFSKVPDRRELSTNTKKLVDNAWQTLRKAYVKEGDREIVDAIDKIAPIKEKERSKELSKEIEREL